MPSYIQNRVISRRRDVPTTAKTTPSDCPTPHWCPRAKNWHPFRNSYYYRSIEWANGMPILGSEGRVQSHPAIPDGQNPKNLSGTAGDPGQQVGFWCKKI
ncbi:hypothetical protein L873DRAFT_1801033 [Choiromyces venosus 120613-1]|uniref:Uncharacterized protein n=1 Tax=Choiromyces venosus 120613-1 TaxID=1336337 RepID=A0A3N4K1I8_9PEZI|nr:hypothetical protein L873DRAFT_1801033 [Choiromyces venosus 120613-1]